MPQLPPDIEACLFDMDGVLTDTASVHAEAWKQTFDPILKAHGDDRPFDLHDDYIAHVDGKKREDGVRDFLASRDIHPSEDEITAIGTTKNDLLLKVMDEQGVKAYDGSKAFLTKIRDAGIKAAIVSSSANAQKAIDAAGYPADCFGARVDGATLKEDPSLNGKPAPDMFLRAAELLGVPKERCAVLEDALAGVEAGRAGGFGITIGVNRADQAAELEQHGADVVIDDLAELTVAPR